MGLMFVAQLPWPHFGLTRTLNAAIYCAPVSSIPAGQQGNGQVADGGTQSTDQQAGHRGDLLVREGITRLNRSRRRARRGAGMERSVRTSDARILVVEEAGDPAGSPCLVHGVFLTRGTCMVPTRPMPPRAGCG
jgi:hypothetical protein